MKLQVALLGLVVCWMSGGGSGVGKVAAWGGLFNRFSPEMLSNMGYGGAGHGGGGFLGRQSAFVQHGGSLSDNMLDEGMEEPCYERHCQTNEDCCLEYVCIHPEGEWPDGRCMFVYGLKQGELCRRDNDCETGLVCAEVAGSDSFSCQPPVTSNKQYNVLVLQRSAGVHRARSRRPGQADRPVHVRREADHRQEQSTLQAGLRLDRSRCLHRPCNVKNGCPSNRCYNMYRRHSQQS
ncbi:unnamed protein product [Trichogramma brassicae]|uniref:Prohormone-3 n=1 Tax=Trichogramma brassicae TaxID=86971 RepID=A0A6H5HXV9_9HYME|nr:unnamed protein product [Trichogramma brassicae]